MKGTINIFQYDWQLQIHTVNLANVAIEKGYNVNIFLCNCSDFICSWDNFHKDIKIYNYGRKDNFFKKILNKINYRLFHFHLFIDRVDSEIIEWTKSKIDKNINNIFIGVEKKGLIWAGKLSEIFNATLIYYSLELYYENPGFYEKNQYTYLRNNEIKYHKSAKITLVQDAFRASHLIRNNYYPNTEIVFCPVSIRKDELIIDDELILKRQKNPVVMYLGKIMKQRFVEPIVKLTTNFNSTYTVWLHGYCFGNYKQELQQIADVNKLKFTDDLLPYNLMKEYIKETSIGICLYRSDYCNDRLTAFSSEKITVFLSLGIPIIVFSNETTSLLFEKYNCGIAIKNTNELDTAIKTILANYSVFSKQALIAYSKLFDFDKNIENFFNKIESI